MTEDTKIRAAIDRLADFCTALLTGKLTMTMQVGLALAKDYAAVGGTHHKAIADAVRQRMGWK